MKNLLIILCFLGSIITVNGQSYAKSEKLGKENGLKKFKIGSIYSTKLNGLTKLKDKKEAWSELKLRRYVVTAAYLADPKKIGFTNYYGLEVERIELLVNDLDVYDKDDNEIENSFILNSIEVYIKLPSDEKSLKEFYAKIKKDYAPMHQSNSEFGKDRRTYYLWVSSSKCGAMMRLQKVLSLSFEKEEGNKFLSLIFTGSCGG